MFLTLNRVGPLRRAAPDLRSLAALLCAVLLVLAGLFPPLAEAAELSARDRQIFDEALGRVEKDQYRKARKVAARASSPLVAKTIQWLDLSRRGTSAGFDEISAFLYANPDWPRRGALRRNAEAAMPPGLPRDRMLAWFERHPPVSAPGVIHYGTALINAGKRAEATRFLRKAWVEKNFTAAEEKTFRKRFMKLVKREDFVARLDRLLWDGRSKAARKQAARLGQDYARLAEARLLLAGTKPGVDYALRRVPARFRDDPGLIYERARWRLRKDRFKGAVALLNQKTARDRSNPSRWWQLRRWAAREAIQAGHYQSAYRMATKHNSKKGAHFAEGEWLAGWIALSFLDQPKRAYGHFTKLYEGVSGPISRARGAYWAAVAGAALGRQDWERRWFEIAAGHSTTFYGQLAAQKLKQPLRIDFSSAQKPDPQLRAAFAQSELARVVEMLSAVGEQSRIGPFIYGLLASAESEGDFTLISELAERARRPDLSLAAAKKARAAGFMIPEHLFPLPDLPGLGDDPETALVLALVRQESSFHHKAISPAGARGLMQLMPATAKREAQKLKVNYRKAWLTAKPGYNLRLGQAHLRHLLAHYRGSPILALAAYNAGSSRVSTWIAEHGDPRTQSIDAVQWIEQIPFSETRNYVQRVLEGRSVYRARLGVTGTPLPLEPATAELYKKAE